MGYCAVIDVNGDCRRCQLYMHMHDLFPQRLESPISFVLRVH